MIPSYIFEVADKLGNYGYEAFLVGGCLRSILMGREPKDFDLTTNALPQQIAEIFPKSILTGSKYGTVTVLIEDSNGEMQNVEVTTYRIEKEYFGGRWPSEVEFTSRLDDDLKRRDFTVNAMALSLSRTNIGEKGLSRDEIKIHIIDLFDGIEDLENRIIRAVGDPIERFREDGLRTLRACRLASVYGFTIEPKTLNAIKQTLDITSQISKERARDEITKLVMNSPKPSVGIELMRVTGLLELFIPELMEGYGMEQNEFHVHDVYRHSLDTVDSAPDEIKFAALFHDIGKARTKEGGHFYGHDQEGADMTRQIMTRLKFPKKEIEDTVNLVRWHMFYVPTRKVKNEVVAPETQEISEKISIEKSERNSKFKDGWSDNAIRRMIRNVGGHEQIDKLIKLRITDAVSNPKAGFNPDDIQKLAQRVAEIRQQDSLMNITDLNITGNDLADLGVEKGPKMRKILEELLEMVIDDIELNTRVKLIEEARKLINSGE